MIRKGDTVMFQKGDKRFYQAESDAYFYDGQMVVDLVGVKESVEVVKLAKLQNLFQNF